MATSERKKEYDIEYARTRLKRVPLNFQKEQYEGIREAAERAGETTSGFIKTAIAERMNRDIDDDTTRKIAAEHGISCEVMQWYIQTATGIDIADKIHPGAKKILLVDNQDDTSIDREILIHSIPELEPVAQKDVIEAILSDDIEAAKKAISDMLATPTPEVPENKH